MRITVRILCLLLWVELNAADHVDAIALQPGDGYIPIHTPADSHPAEEMEALHKLTGKPIIICDHQVSFATPRYLNSIRPYYQRANESEAAAATAQFIHGAMACDFIPGYVRRPYIDRYSQPRNANKLGLIRDDGSPSEIPVDAYRRANQVARIRSEKPS